MAAIPDVHDHGMVALIGWVELELEVLAKQAVWPLSADEVQTALESLTRARGELDALLMRLLVQGEAVGAGLETGATSTTNWWSHATRTTRAEAHRTARLARHLEEHGTVADALAAGELRTDQARVIVDAVDALPDDVESWVPAKATRFLLGKASEHDAKTLRVLGRRLLEVVDPAAADAEEARRLEAEEADAHAKAWLTLTDDGHGTCHGRFVIPSLHGAMLAKDLKARVSRTRRTATATTGGDGATGATGSTGATGGDGQRPRLTKHAMGQAFTDYLEAPKKTPKAGGIAATVVVTMELETLMGGLRAASLDTGGRVSAGEARRLACRAGVIPVVLGGPSRPLDVGRKRRFHTEAQRIAMGIRDGGCTVEGCDAPPGMTEAHHDEQSWSQGGGTSVEKGRLLCTPHHHTIHDPRFVHSIDQHGKVRFTRRT